MSVVGGKGTLSNVRRYMTDTVRLRVRVAAWIAICAPFVGLLLLGSEGVWLAMILGIVSLPLIGLACLIGVFFASSIVCHPLPWTAAAVVVCLYAGFQTAGRAGLMLGGIVATALSVVFLFSLRQWPLRKSAQAFSEKT